MNRDYEMNLVAFGDRLLCPWNIPEAEPTEHEVWFALDEGYDICIRYQHILTPVREAEILSWNLTESGRWVPVDPHTTGWALDEIYIFIEEKFEEEFNEGVVW